MIGELRVFPLKVHAGVLLAHSVDDIRVGHPPLRKTMTFLRFGGLSPLGDYRGVLGRFFFWFKDGLGDKGDTPLCTR